MPSEALQSINRLRLPFPLLFEVKKFGRASPSKAASRKQVLHQYKRRIENIYRSTNPTKLQKIDKWLSKYGDDPHDLYLKVCRKYGIMPKPKISFNKGDPQKRRKSGHGVKQKSFGKQYCSVYEFSSPQPDSIYIPHWMMQNLGIDEGGKIELQSQFNVPKGSFCRLQPFKKEFMDKVSTIGYKSTLEHSLRHYSVLSLNQRIVVEFNHFPYECIVKELKPANAVSILGSTDLEIEFEEPIENESGYGVAPIDVTSENLETEIEDKVESERDEESSSLGLSELEQSVEALAINGVIDGALLEKLGVPLDYNEQTNLATMIIENRKLQQDDDTRFHGYDASGNLVADIAVDDGTLDAVQSSDVDEKMVEEQEPQIGPDDVQCENCGKYVHSMSIQMHTMHCIRKNTTCEICGECIKIEDKETHFEDYHKEITCICNTVCIGKIAHQRHSKTECTLRLRRCPFCERDNITANTFEDHVAKCKEEEVVCPECGVAYLRKNKQSHDCGVICPLCGIRISESKDKLLHLITVCKERRAVCNYCGVLRGCDDMDEHRKFCGSRSEKCEKCNEFVSLMNMELHQHSNCQWFNNNQLSAKNSKKRKTKGTGKNGKRRPNGEYMENPYIDERLLDDQVFAMSESHQGDDAVQNGDDSMKPDKNSLFGLLAQNPEPTMISTTVDEQENTKQLCPHCKKEDRFMSREEFELHMAVSHPTLIDDTLTQTVFAAFADPDLVTMSQSKRRKVSLGPADIDMTVRGTNPIKTAQWSCSMCTYMNASTKRRCQMCQTPRG